MATDIIKVKVIIDGPRAWQVKVIDADTGKLLPVKPGSFSIDVGPEGVSATMSLWLSGADIDPAALKDGGK